MENIRVAHLVKSEDLNHHGTLFAGRMAEWFVEACFIIAAQSTQKPENIVCLKMHGLRFNAPAQRGDIIHITTHIVKAGRTSFCVYGRTTRNNDQAILAEGFVTFVFVDHDGKPIPHHLMLDQALTADEAELRRRAAELS